MGELTPDDIDRRLHLDQVPKWPERCRKCITANSLDPASTLYCDPDTDCEYYPFKDDK